MPAISKKKEKLDKSEAEAKAVESVEVEVLGQRVAVRVDHDQRRIEQLAEYVNRKQAALSQNGPVSSSKLAVLTALNIADDYFKVLEESRGFKREVARRSRSLLKELQ